MKLKCFTISLCAMGLVVSSVGQAYNFLYFNRDSEPLGWEPGSTITYYVDRGGLGRLSNAHMLTLIQKAMEIWTESVPDYVDLPVFEFGGCLPIVDEDIRAAEVVANACDETVEEEVDGGNYEEFISSVNSVCFALDEDENNNLPNCQDLMRQELKTVFIFDDGDEFMEDVVCGNSCLAAAGPGVIGGHNDDPDYFLQSFMGFDLSMGQNSFPINALMGVIVHELGHMLGLAHNVVNQEIFIERLTDQQNLLSTMLYTTLGNSELNSMTPHPDDIVGMANLYKGERFAEETVTISGAIVTSTGDRPGSLMIIARNIDDPLCESFSYFNGKGCEEGTVPFDAKHDACYYEEEDNYFYKTLFRIEGLPPGSYTIEVNELADENRVRIATSGFFRDIPGNAEFWDDSEAVVEENSLHRSSITLNSGESQNNIFIQLDGNEVQDDRRKYIPLSEFEPSNESSPWPETRCPEEPPEDYALLIGFPAEINPEPEPGPAGEPFIETSNSGGCILIKDARPGPSR